MLHMAAAHDHCYGARLNQQKLSRLIGYDSEDCRFRHEPQHQIHRLFVAALL